MAHVLEICANAGPDLIGGQDAAFLASCRVMLLLRSVPGPDLEELGAEAPQAIPVCSHSKQPVPVLEILPGVPDTTHPGSQGDANFLFYWSEANIFREGNVSPFQIMHLYKTK